MCSGVLLLLCLFQNRTQGHTGHCIVQVEFLAGSKPRGCLCASLFLPFLIHSWILSPPFVGCSTFNTHILSAYPYICIYIYLYLCLVTITLDCFGIPGKRFSSLMSPKVYHWATICLSDLNRAYWLTPFNAIWYLESTFFSWNVYNNIFSSNS